MLKRLRNRILDFRIELNLTLRDRLQSGYKILLRRKRNLNKK